MPTDSGASIIDSEEKDMWPKSLCAAEFSFIYYDNIKTVTSTQGLGDILPFYVNQKSLLNEERM